MKDVKDVKLSVTPRLNEILKERNITQMQLAEMTGISQGAISRFDRNKQHVDLHLFTIADALELKIEDLFKCSYQNTMYTFLDESE